MHDALSHPFNLDGSVFAGLRAGQDLVYILVWEKAVESWL